MPKLGSQHQNLDAKIYHAVKSMIVERKLTPGVKIYQDKLAQELGVSRTPLVNALKKLEHENLISAIPRRGFYVRLVSDEAEELKAYAEEDRKFHKFLIEISGQGILTSILETYNVLTFSYQTTRVAGLIRSPSETLPEHLAIIDAISQRNPEQAEKVARQHLVNSANRLREQIAAGTDTTELLQKEAE